MLPSDHPSTPPIILCCRSLATSVIAHCPPLPIPSLCSTRTVPHFVALLPPYRFCVAPGRYASSCVVVLFATFNPGLMTPPAKGEGYTASQGLFIFFFLASSLFTFTWDIIQDYGLFTWKAVGHGSEARGGEATEGGKGSGSSGGERKVDDDQDSSRDLGDDGNKAVKRRANGKKGGGGSSASSSPSSSSSSSSSPAMAAAALVQCPVELRKRRMYRHKWVYIAVVPYDFIGRFIWTLTIVPNFLSNGLPWLPGLAVYISPVLAGLELARRAVWAFFRLEREHLDNTSGYRRVAFIPLHFETPLHHDDTKEKAQSARKRVAMEVAMITLVVVALGVTAVLPVALPKAHTDNATAVAAKAVWSAAGGAANASGFKG